MNGMFADVSKDITDGHAGNDILDRYVRERRDMINYEMTSLLEPVIKNE